MNASHRTLRSISYNFKYFNKIVDIGSLRIFLFHNSKDEKSLLRKKKRHFLRSTEHSKSMRNIDRNYKILHSGSKLFTDRLVQQLQRPLRFLKIQLLIFYPLPTVDNIIVMGDFNLNFFDVDNSNVNKLWILLD